MFGLSGSSRLLKDQELPVRQEKVSPFFVTPSITEDRGEDNENDFSEKGERIPYTIIYLDQKNHSRKGSGSVLVLI